MKPKAVLFDMDGVIVDSERLSYDLVTEILFELGYRLSLDLYSKTIGISEQNGAKLYSDAFPYVDGQTDVLDKLYALYPQAIRDGRLKAKPGMLKLLDYLDKNGIKKAVASSNVAEIVFGCLDAIGVKDRFDTIVCAEDVENVKPSPELYQEAMRRLEVTPGDCLVLEDSQPGVQAAHSAGVPVIVIPDMLASTETTRALCMFECKSLFDVIEYLQKL